MRLSFPLASIAIAALPIAAPAINFLDPASPIVLNAGNNSGRIAAAADPRTSGGRRGRLLVAYAAPDSNGFQSIWFTAEGTAGNNDFSAPIRISPNDGRNYRDPEIAVTAGGVVHVAYVGPNTVNNGVGNAIFYTRISSAGSISISPKRVTSTVTSSDQPSISVAEFSANTNPVIVYTGSDPLVATNPDLEVLMIVGENAGGNFSAPINLSNDTTSGEATPVIRMVNALQTNAVQGAVVWTKNNVINAMMITSATSAGPILGTVQQLGDSARGRNPALAIQTVNSSIRGAIGHLAFVRVGAGQEGTISYMQFADQPTAGTTNWELYDLVGPSSFGSASRPSIAVDPTTSYTASPSQIFSRRVHIAYSDNAFDQISAARNAGGLSAAFGFLNNQPTTAFSDTGVYFPSGTQVFGEGPQTVALTAIGSTNYLRIATRERGFLKGNTQDFVVINEVGLPTPTPTPTPTASPSASPTASRTPTASPSASATATTTATASASATASPTAAVTASATATSAASPTASRTPGPTPSPSASPTRSPSPTVSASPTASEIPTPSLTPSPIPPVGVAQIRNVLLRRLGSVSPGQFAEGDRNADLVWDSADVTGAALLNLP